MEAEWGLAGQRCLSQGLNRGLDKRSVPRQVAANPKATSVSCLSRFLAVNNPGWPGAAEVKG